MMFAPALAAQLQTRSTDEHFEMVTDRTQHEKHKALSPDVVRRVHLLWSDSVERGRICEALTTYGVESYEQEADRVRLAILKLSDGTEEKAMAMVVAAKQDFRDVLMWAEYPEQGRTMLPLHRSLTRAEMNHFEQVRRRDRKQYEEWLKKDRS